MQRLQKTLEDANLKLGSVLSQVMGKSGRAILDALVDGEADPDKLLALVQRGVKAPPETLRAALQGRITARGKWHGNKYRFFTRFRSDDSASLAAEFEAPFARLDYVRRDCFDLLWHRHTGAWHRVAERLSLTEALHRIASEPYFQPC